MRAAWQDLDLRHLTTFVTLAEERSFRATASRLGFAQSAISQHIATLEQRVGARLVERTPGSRQVELTDAGRVLLEHASAILARVAIAERDFEQHGRSAERTVKLGAFQSVSANLVAPVVAETSRLGRVTVELETTGSPLELLTGGLVDLALSESGPASDLVRYVELMRDPYVLVVPRKRAIAAADITIERLANMPLLTYEASCHLRKVGRDLALRSGIALKSLRQSDDVLTLQSLVVHGLGFALIPKLALTADDPRLRTLPVDAIPPRAICLSWNAERSPTPQMKLLIDAFVTTASRRQTTAGAGIPVPPTLAAGRGRPRRTAR